MKKPSQDLVKQEAKLKHLQTEQQQLEKTLESQKLQASKDIEEIKELGLSALQNELQEGKESLKKLNNDITEAQKSINALRIEREEESEKLLSLIDEQKQELKIVRESFQSLSDRNLELESTKTVLESDIEGLRNDKHSLDLAIDEAKAQKSQQETELEAVSENLSNTKQEFSDTIDQLTSERDKLEADIKSLEYKKYTLTQEIIEERKGQEQIVENLATRQRELDSQDENLRIREEKLRHRERVIVRNSNLLNL